MKNLFKMLILVMVLACTLVLGACDEKEKDVLVVATNCEFPPFEYTDKDGKEIGIDMELAKEIADILGYKLEIKDMKFDAVLTALEAKQANIAMAGLTVSEKRLETVDFCDPYFKASQVVIGKKGSAAESLETEEALIAELEGKKIGFQTGTVAQYYVEGDEGWEFPGIKDAEAKGYTSGATAIEALKNGQIDYVIIDLLPAEQFVSKNAEALYVNKSVKLTDEDYAFAVQKGDTELAKKVNDALKTLKENGKFDSIVNKYYSE